MENIKWEIEFEDEGQDLQKVFIDKSGIIIKSEWFGKMFVGRFTIPQTAKVGGKLPILINKQESFIKYPIKRITKITK